MKKILTTLIIVAIIIGAMAMQTVSAASIKFTATPSATKVDAGKTITIDLKISDINAGELGINTLSCVFKYDENVFENVKITSKNNWSITYNDEKGNEQYGTLLAMLLSAGVKTDQEIGTITLKVKENAKGKTGNINFTKIASNDGKNDIPVADKAISIKVNGTASSGDGNGSNNQIDGNTEKDPGNSGNNQGGSQNTNNSNGSNNNSAKNETGLNIIGSNNNENKNNNKQQENISKGKLPQTGYYETAIIVAIVVAILAIIISYIKYQKYKETK